MSENLTATLQLNPPDLLITLNSKLAECTNSVFFGMNALETTTELPESLSSQEDSIFMQTPIGNLTLEQSKENFKYWILKKGFEDLISALTELLISFSHIIDLNEKIQKNNKLTLEKFKELIFEPNDSNSTKNFPSLIKKVESSLKYPLKFKSEVETINRVRRCLAHRNGIVRPTDFNTENGLKLKWWFWEMKLTNEGQTKILERFDIITSETKMEMNEIPKTKLFTENQRIEFNYQEFNELALFCQRFGIDLLDKFKLN
ncbi:hypothetical protein ACFSKN_11355 [Mariniflexile gromovii]|uniref:DZIP3-like HEPN domain-containing protein n=1 Tax=Mariniflexile gromovii TaxID=362523 RepID=A0ABS4BYX0_9FLAO|nr:hypothetical protein [Mariniflexile gromovii]MBP0905232.1 hypothetical protein [Mariniflexile gromovii]